MSFESANYARHRFTSPDNVDQNWLDWFREEFSPRLTKVDMTPAPDIPFVLDGVSRVLPDVSVYRGMCSPSLSRNRVDLATDDDPSIVVALAGTMSLHSAGRDVELTPGTAVTVSNDAPNLFAVQDTASFLMIRLRRRWLDPFIRGPSPARNLAPIRDPQALRLLLGYVRALEAEDTIAAPETQHLVTTHIHELAALAIGASGETHAVAEGRGKRAARLAAIKADILANLNDPNLSVGAVAARQRMTPRYLHLLFEADGTTFTECVLAHRLTNAHRLLCNPRHIGEAIGTIALQVGFSDLSYFNRTFRRRFGMTPSEARAVAAAAK